MKDSEISNTPQCLFFVIRKKRLCRMTVKPGRQYCGEHEPKPTTEQGESDKRVPCPNDPKHTCYLSKLEKHMAICNARAGELPPYIVHNINAPPPPVHSPRRPLSEISKEDLMKVIEKVNHLYKTHIENNIETIPEKPIHHSVLKEFSELDRTESSLRHLRQASSLLWLMEEENMVQNDTCYVELGAGKGLMSYYAGVSWCAEGSRSRVLLVDRASLRHKRDNKLPPDCCARIRADLAHLALQLVPQVQEADSIIGFAKHLCGVASDFAIRCAGAARGLALATCCHHRCQLGAYVGELHLQELGLSHEDFNIMLGIVSWATCGDGRSRAAGGEPGRAPAVHSTDTRLRPAECAAAGRPGRGEDPAERAATGRRAKALLDWGRVLHLRARGFDARLCHFVPAAVSLENVCIVATRR